MSSLLCSRAPSMVIPSEKGINLLMLRSMQKAIYSELNLGHYGLSFKYYTHFTSPIRRYPDLIVHRLLRSFLFTKIKSTEIINYYNEKMKDIAVRCSETERTAVLLEREVVDMKKAEYISQYINKQFDGIINSVTGFGIYVSLPNTVEGLVHISAMQDDYYVYDQDLMMLVGERRKKSNCFNCFIEMFLRLQYNAKTAKDMGPLKLKAIAFRIDSPSGT